MNDIVTLLGASLGSAGVLYALVQGVFKLLDRRANTKTATRDQLLEYLKEENREANERIETLSAELKQTTSDLWRVRQELYRHQISDPTEHKVSP